VGEGSTFTMPNYLHGYLGIDPTLFHREVHPTYKLGIRFLWGPRPEFYYSFTSQLDTRYSQLPKANGFYCDEDFLYADLTGALMAHNRVFERQSDGGPLVQTNVAYHLENEHFVAFLEKAAADAGIEIVDDTVQQVEQDDRGITALRMESGNSLSADLYVDCSGFRGELIGKHFEEPFIDYTPSLFCDRAVIGGWERTDEPLKPYTTSETMNGGWCWQIEHDHFINRGYVYSSNFISDDEAERELREKNPKVGQTRIVKFSSGRYRNTWVKNAVALGNSSGFVEPLEATALAIIIDHAAALVRTLVDSDMQIRPVQREYFNKYNAFNWDCIRRFLAMHYNFNTRIDNDFWRACRNDLDLADAAPIVEFYKENGPSLLWARSVIGATDPFGWEGYLAMLVGQKVPYAHKHKPSEQEQQVWSGIKQQLKTRALAAMPQEEALSIIRSDNWGWRPDFYANASTW
jgi:tryptophan halogenase